MTPAPHDRVTTGLPALDALLGGGLRPGTLTVVLGATGVGKTQLGLHFVRAGVDADGAAGCVVDLTARGDDQGHADYARRLLGRGLTDWTPPERITADDLWPLTADRFAPLAGRGVRVTADDLTDDDRRLWRAELVRKSREVAAFLYGRLSGGCRRAVLDGVEPVPRESDSVQFRLIDTALNRVLFRAPGWVARELLRENFRRHADAVAAHAYDPAAVTAVLLLTAHEVTLDALLARPLTTGDALSNANTVILMGRTPRDESGRVGRALHVAKHRGSACDDRVVPFEVTDAGLVLGG